MRPLALALLASLPATSLADERVELAQLRPGDPGNFDRFGLAVDIDGEVVLVGAPFNNTPEAGGEAGAAYLFQAADGAQTARLVAADGDQHDFFGSAVALQGNSAFIGATQNDGAGSLHGAVYVFDTATGLQTDKLLHQGAAPGDHFGGALAVDGDVLAVGAARVDVNGSQSGAVYLFSVSSGLETAMLLADDGAAGDLFGASLALDGTTLIVGAPGDADNGLESGSAYLFDVVTGQQLAKLVPSTGAPGDGFGQAVHVAGPRAIVGARRHDGFGTDAGSAWIFDSASGAQLLQLAPADVTPHDGFGSAVLLDGDRAIVGAPLLGGLQAERAAVYVLDALTGQQVEKFGPSDDPDNSAFGAALAQAGARLAIGAFAYSSANHVLAGAAYTFDLRGAIGTPYCGPGQVNSTGSAGRLCAFGSTAVADGFVQLTARDLPPAQFSMFLTAPAQGTSTPPGSQGTLCLGGAIGRYNLDIQPASAFGVATLQPDLANTPTPTGFVAIQPGETWNFQLWHRDFNPGPTSNFTDAVSIDFE